MKRDAAARNKEKATGEQGRRERTRTVHTAPVQGTRTVHSAPVRPTGPCCTPVIVATFRHQVLVRLENRHLGRYCAGDLDLLSIPEWRKAKGLR